MDFVKKVVFFKCVFVQGNSLFLFLVSIFSGVYFLKYKFVRDSEVLLKDFIVFGEGMKKAGWINGFFFSNGYVSTKRGFV